MKIIVNAFKDMLLFKDMPSSFLNKHFKIIIHISFACVCVFEALFNHRYIEKPSEFNVMVWLVWIYSPFLNNILAHHCTIHCSRGTFKLLNNRWCRGIIILFVQVSQGHENSRKSNFCFKKCINPLHVMSLACNEPWFI